METSGKIDSSCVKEDIKPPKEIRTLGQFISWQNQEQQKSLEAIQKKRQNPRG